MKIRAWDTYHKKMIYSNEYAVTFDGEVVHVGANIHFQKQLIPLLGTGIKSANGKFIYDGDVVTIKKGTHFYSKYETIIGRVTYHRLYAQFEIRGIAQNNYHWFNQDGANCFNWQELIVIGNTYENPELLESENVAS